MKATKKRKFSLGMKIVSILACLAIVSVGFASWWIVNLPKTEEFSTGSFEVYAVSEKTISFANVAEETSGDSKIVFGKPASGSVTWLGYTNDVQAENLDAVIKFDVNLDAANETLNTYLENIKITFDPGAKYAALQENYVAAPTVAYRVGESGTFTTATLADGEGTAKTFTIPAPNTQNATIYLQFTFDWGKITNGENPYTYFNGKDQTATNSTLNKTEKEAAKDMLGKLNTDLASQKYNVKIEATPKAAS